MWVRSCSEGGVLTSKTLEASDSSPASGMSVSSESLIVACSVSLTTGLAEMVASTNCV